MSAMADSRPFDETVASADDAPSSLRASLSAELAQARQGGSADAPKKLGDYFVLERIGAGAMGSVWACYDPNLDRKVAVKLLHADRSDPKAHVRLVAEARALARLSHPNVVTVHEVGTVPGGPHAGASFVVMEFVEGQDLEGWLEQEHPWQAILEAFVAAGEGLWAAHQAGIVHRDFKPANVLVSSLGAVKVADFGLARAQVGDAQGLEGNAYATQGVAGTPIYMAPEQFVGGTITPAADQFAFCVSLCQALTKDLPHDGKSVADIMEAKFSEAVTIKDPKDGPKGIGVILTRGLSIEPDDRFADMGVVLDQLRALLAPPSRAVWWGAGAAAFATVAAAAVILSRPEATASVAPEAATCVGFEDAVHEVWDDQGAATLDKSFGNSGAPGAGGAVPHVITSLDRWADEFVQTRTGLCRDHDNGEITDTVHEGQLACLEERFAVFRSTVELLEQADQSIVAGSEALVEGLPPTPECRSVNIIFESVSRPSDPQAREAGDETIRAVSEAYVLVRGGKMDQAKAALDALEPRLETLDDPKAKGELARALAAHREPEQRVRLLRLAAADGSRASDPLLTGYALLDLSRAHLQLRQFAAASTAGELARAHADRFGDQMEAVGGTLVDAQLRSQSLANEAEIEAAQGHVEASVRLQYQSLGAVMPYAERIPGAVLNGQNNLAEALRSMGRYAQARPLYDSAIGLAQMHLGAQHPTTITTLQNRGGYFIEAGRLDLGDAALHAARRRAERVLPEHAFAKGLIAFNIGVLEGLYGNPERNRAELVDARAHFEKTLPPGHPFIALTEVFSGAPSRLEGEPAQALATQEPAYATLQTLLGDNHPLSAIAAVEVGLTLTALGRREDAMAHIDRAIEGMRATSSLATQAGASALAAKGALLRQAGRDEAALAVLDSGVDILESGAGPMHWGLVELLLERGRAHRASGDRQRAVRDLRRALALARTSSLDPRIVGLCAAWLAATTRDAEERADSSEQARAALEIARTDATELRLALAAAQDASKRP